MVDILDKVREESDAFEAALPELMKSLAGRWVVFMDGAVQGDYATEDEAYNDAVERFGLCGGFVVAQVAPIEPAPISAAFTIGLG